MGYSIRRIKIYENKEFGFIKNILIDNNRAELIIRLIDNIVVIK